MVIQLLQLPLQYCVPRFSFGNQRSYGVYSSPYWVANWRSSGTSDDRWLRPMNIRRFSSVIAKQEKGDTTEIRVPVPLTLEQQDKEKQNRNYEEDEDEEGDVDPEDLKYVNEIKRVLELLRRNRDMMFSEVKLTIMIEDPREVERRRLLGIEDSETPSRDDLAEALEHVTFVNEGKIPKDRTTLQMLYEEMIRWPNLEVEVSQKQRGKSLYAKSTDTGIDPKEAAKRLNVDWDLAAAIEDADVNEEQGVVTKVAVYGALYFVSALPVIIGVSVVLILFYNSLQ